MTDKCLICGSENVEAFPAEAAPFLKSRMFGHRKIDERIVHCRECDIFYLAERPADEEMKHYYQHYMTGEYVSARDAAEPGFKKWHDGYMANDFSKELSARKEKMTRLFSRYLPLAKIENVLDYGGARGEFIPEMFGRCARYVYDLDDTPTVEGVHKIRDFHELKNYRWDFVMSCHCLEHVADPMEILNKIIDLMPVGGYLYVELPFEDYVYQFIEAKKPLPIHEHINLFRKQTLEKIFDRRDFIVLENKVEEFPFLFGQNRIIATLVQKVEPDAYSFAYQQVHRCFVVLEAQQHALMVEMKSLAAEQASRGERLTALLEQTDRRLAFIDKIFSVKKTAKGKVIRLLGLTFKFKRKKGVL